MYKDDGIVTSDLSKFGHRELGITRDLLSARLDQGLPKEFYDDGVTVAFNTHSGCVFLTNAEFQTVMLNGDKLESWYNCPICGHEGFLEDMKHNEYDKECQEYLKDIGVI